MEKQVDISSQIKTNRRRVLEIKGVKERQRETDGRGRQSYGHRRTERETQRTKER